MFYLNLIFGNIKYLHICIKIQHYCCVLTHKSESKDNFDTGGSIQQ